MQATVRGIVTGLVDPRTCSATDAQNFDTHYDPDASPRLVNYITNLPIGISAFPRPRFVRTVSLVRLTFMLVYSSFVSSRIVVLVHRVIMVCTVLIVLFYRLFILWGRGNRPSYLSCPSVCPPVCPGAKSGAIHNSDAIGPTTYSDSDYCIFTFQPCATSLRLQPFSKRLLRTECDKVHLWNLALHLYRI